MTFRIIGTGNIAWFLGTRLAAARHQCTGVYGRDPEKAKALAEALLCDKYGTIADMEDGKADVCFMAIADSAIADAAVHLSLKQTILVHTAGAVEIGAIAAAADDRAVLWPVYSIVKTNLPTHRDIPCAWEASSEKAKRIVLSMAHAITDDLFEADYEQRRWLHLSAVISNNFTTHLVAICERICAEHDIPFSTLSPIIAQTFDRIKQGSPRSPQTGPAARGDMSTIDSQLALLEQHPHWQKIYGAVTGSIIHDRVGDKA